MGFGLEEAWECEMVDDHDDFLVWKGRDGTSYLVSEMKTSHIRNCLRMMDANRFKEEWMERYGDDWRSVFNKELASRCV
jgi:hypothetical protein